MLRKLTILVIVFAGIAVVAVGVAAFIRARNTPSAVSCVNNLRKIGGAKKQWAIENHKTTNDTPKWDVLLPYVIGGKQLTCPQGGKYTLGNVVESASCSIGGPSHSYKND